MGRTGNYGPGLGRRVGWLVAFLAFRRPLERSLERCPARAPVHPSPLRSPLRSALLDLAAAPKPPNHANRPPSTPSWSIARSQHPLFQHLWPPSALSTPSFVPRGTSGFFFSPSPSPQSPTTTNHQHGGTLKHGFPPNAPSADLQFHPSRRRVLSCPPPEGPCTTRLDCVSTAVSASNPESCEGKTGSYSLIMLRARPWRRHVTARRAGFQPVRGSRQVVWVFPFLMPSL